MNTYIGTKIIRAELMTERDWQHKKGLPFEGEAYRWGYMVVYPDGYESWSPKDVFETAYRLITDGEFDLVTAPHSQDRVQEETENDAEKAGA